MEQALVSAKPAMIQFLDIGVIREVFLTTPIPSSIFEIPKRPPRRDEVLAQLNRLRRSPDDICGPPIGECYQFADLDK
jgi:hypothetical protein